MGVDVVRYDVEHVAHLRRMQLVRDRQIDLVLDVGANDGPYAKELRAAGYRHRIVSFEPQSVAFAALASACADDPLWECRRLALGSSVGESVLNIAANSSSSSLLGMSPLHVESAPGSAYVGTERVPVTTLDTIRSELADGTERIYLKVDVQGSELDVLRGAEATLAQSALVQVELSLVPLYDGAAAFDDVIGHLRERGFDAFGLEPVFVHPRDGRVLQVDAVFGRQA